MKAFINKVGDSLFQSLPLQAFPCYWRCVGSKKPFPPSYYHYREEVRKHEFESSEEIERLSFAKARDMVRYANRHSQYYRELFLKHGIRAEGDLSYAQFQRIPFLTKGDVRNNLVKLRSGDPSTGPHIPMTTGGSTGIPLAFYVERDQAANELAFIHHFWNAIVGYTWGDRIVRLRGHVFPNNSLRYYYRNDNALGLSSYFLVDELIEKYMRWMGEFNPAYFHAYPSSMFLLAGILRRNSISVKFPGLKAILCGSENVYESQRKMIESVFGVPVFSWYGHAEACLLAVECGKVKEYHFVPTYGYFELIDKQGNNVTTEGAVGEIVGTGFLNRATPFIRYRTMDYGILARRSCPCGRSYPKVSRIEGRLQEMILTGGGRLISMTSINMHDDTFLNVRQFQFRQKRRGVVELFLMKTADFTDADKRRIRSALSEKLGNDTELEIYLVESIAPTSSGKHRFLIQEIPEIAMFDPSSELQR